MPRKRISKQILLESRFENILVCNNKKLRPSLEIFVQEPENVTLNGLGTIFGIFELSGNPEESSYLANFLVSIIKKEYFSKSKRGAIESFEAALHKANLALSKLAEHGNVNWIGKLNAVIAVIEKNNLHLARAGTASAFLFRAKGMTDISEGLASEDPEPHPLKTFINISSGRLEKDDKLIIATEEIFDIFSLEEIKKSALRFSEEKFIQFLKTALGNELEKAAVLLVNISEKYIKPYAPAPQKTNELNPFSQAAFSKPARPQPKTAEKIAEEIIQVKESLPSEKNGHIYIKESAENSESSQLLANYLAAAQKKAATTAKAFQQLLAVILSFSWIKEIHFPEINFHLPQSKKDIAETDAEETVPEIFAEETKIETLPVKTNYLLQLKEKLADRMTQISLAELSERMLCLGRQIKLAGASLLISAKKILPDFKKMEALVSQMNYQQRISALFIVMAMLIVPFFAIKLQNNLEKNKDKPAPQPVIMAIPLENDKNVIRIENLNAVLSDESAPQPVNLNGKTFAVTASKIIDLESRENFEIPSDFPPVAFATAMNDLNFIFLINKNNQILHFSPLSKKFQPDAFTTPANLKIAGAETYLTYLYLADAANNMVYRYPRAEGGFGEKIDWLKDSAQFENISGMAIDENVYAANSETIQKFFRGKKLDANFEQSATPIHFNKIFTNDETENIYILDKDNGRIIKYSKNGALITQYYNEKIKSALDLTANEETNKIYFSSPEELFEFGIQ